MLNFLICLSPSRSQQTLWGETEVSQCPPQKVKGADGELQPLCAEAVSAGLFLGRQMWSQLW